jgi:type VII secretion protein EccB
VAEESRGQRGSGYGLGLSTRTQVTGYQFLARRTAMALTRWRVRMEVEPGRRQNLAVVASVSASLVICLGALLYSFISPSGQITPDSKIIADRDSGALYVNVGDRLYPALNLASARLITGRPDNPHLVKGSQINSLPHGPLVGIPGAPSQFAPKAPQTSSWAVCDTVDSTAVGTPKVTVIDGTPDLSTHRRVLSGSDAVVLTHNNESWVVRGAGRRSRIDGTNRAVLLPLGLTPEQVSQAKPMSQALFDSLSVGPELVVPEVPNAGATANFQGAPGVVGTVLVTPQISGPQQYSLVLSDGVQTLPLLVARILLSSDGPNTKPVTVEPAALAKMPVVNKLDLSSYPDDPLNVVDIRENPSTCWWWERTAGESHARIQVITGPTLPIPSGDTSKIVNLVKSDTSGRVADQVFFGQNYANFVAVTGNNPAAQSTESMWWLTEAGARFGVEDTREVREALGLMGNPSVAPWVALRLLPQGPTLSRTDALVEHDTLPTDQSPAELVVPK